MATETADVAARELTRRIRPPQSRFRFDQRILLLALAAGLPAALVALILLWTGDSTPKVQWAGCSFSVRHRVVLPLQTLSNLLAALRESDFSIRARGASGPGTVRDDPLGAVLLEVNVLASMLHDQRLGALEAGALLRTVMVEIDVAVFTFDGTQTLRLVNRAGERLLQQPVDRLLGRAAAELGLRDCLDGPTPRIAEAAFPGGAGRWEVRRTTFRQEGRPHQLLVLADVSRPLRDEERQAWQRLIRVIGHEINNSLAPIKSIAGSLESMLVRDALPADWNADMRRGLAVIAARSDSLSRFTTAYARLAKLPAPRLDAVPVAMSPSVPIPISSNSCSSTFYTMPWTLRSRRAAASRSPGPAKGAPSSSGSRTKGPGCRTRRTCSCRSSRRNRAGRASAWCSAGKSRKRTAAR